MNQLNDTDYGTPGRVATQEVTLEIDGVSVTVAADTSVMRAAVEAGVNVPKLCATDSLEPFGFCRLCLVEIEGKDGRKMKGYPASCTTPCEPGMKVQMPAGRYPARRDGAVHLRPSARLSDLSYQRQCELQDMASAVGLREVRYGYEGENHLELKKDERNPYFTYDPSKCIVCNRCVQAYLTATLTEKTVIMLGQAEYSKITTCAYCGVGCSFKAEMKGNEVVRIVPYKDGQANHGHSCVKGCFAWGVTLNPEPGLRIPNMFDAVLDCSFQGLYCKGEDIVQSDPNTQHGATALQEMECIVVQDKFLNETAKYAHVFLPGSSFLEKDGTFTNAERRVSRARKVIPSKSGKSDWEVTTMALAAALDYLMPYNHLPEIMDEIAVLIPSFHGVSYDKLERLGSIQWPCNEVALAGTPIMHIGSFIHGKGKLIAIFCDRREGNAVLSTYPDHWSHPVAVQRRRADAAHR